MMANEEEFRPAVQLLLARMKSSPEEFGLGHNKYRAWTDILESVQVHATEAELVALTDALSDIRMEELHHRAMKLILQDKQPEDYDTEEARWKATERYSTGYTSLRGMLQEHTDAAMAASIKAKQDEAMKAYRRQNNVNIRQLIQDGVERVFNK